MSVVTIMTDILAKAVTFCYQMKSKAEEVFQIFVHLVSTFYLFEGSHCPFVKANILKSALILCNPLYPC